MKKIIKHDVLKTHSFTFNPEDNGGESLSLTTQFIANGDPITPDEGIFLNQELSLQSYCNSASINMFGISFTPKALRELANQLESERNKLVYENKSNT